MIDQQDFIEVIGAGQYSGWPAMAGPHCHDDGIRSYGTLVSGVMFIGISPARDEMKTKRPLTGPSGQVLDAILSAVEIERKDVFCTNLVCHWQNEPTKEEADKCNGRLVAEIKYVKPKLIILLGGIVTEYFTGKKLSKMRGAVQWSVEYNCYIMSTLHPAAILRSMGEYGSSKDDKASSMIHDFVRDMQKIKDVLTWKPEAPEAKVEYSVIDSPQYAQSVLNSFIQSPDHPVALDVETTYNKDDEEVDVFKDTVLCVGVSDGNHAWVFTPRALYKKDGTSALTWHDGIHWTMHNAIFDAQVMKQRLGVWIPVREDTMLQSYSLDERSGIHRLKTLAREYLGAGFWEDDRFFGKLKLDQIPADMLYKYNAHDTTYTARLCRKFKQRQIDDEVRGFYERLLIPAVNMYKEVQYNGVQIDKKLHEKFAVLWGKRYLADEDELCDMAEQEGWQGRININSPQQLSRFLYKILSLPITKYTKGGAPSTDQSVLESLQGQHVFIDKLIAFRHLAHMYGLYILGLMSQIKDDGKAHAVVKLHGSRTGRPSYTKPPLQTIPVPYMYGDDFGLLRQLFIAKEPDDLEEYMIIEADYGKAEIWAAQAYSGDKQMYQDLTSGDYHTTVAMDVLQKPLEDVTGKDRLDMKKVTFGIMYDREAPSLSKAIESSVVEAQKYINRFFARNKEYAIWFKETQKAIQQDGELVTVTGRKRRIIILGSAVRALKQAVNFKIQSTVSDLVLDAAIEMHPKLNAIGARILFSVHDSIVARAPKSRLEEAQTIMHDSMTAIRFEGMPPLPVEIKVGDSWGTCKEVHDCAKLYCLWSKPNS